MLFEAIARFFVQGKAIIANQAGGLDKSINAALRKKPMKKGYFEMASELFLSRDAK